MSSVPVPDIEKIRERFFPYQLPSGFIIKAVPEEEMRAFLNTAFKDVFPESGEHPRFLLSPERREQLQPMYKLYKVLHHESFLFFDQNGSPVGWHMGEAEDMLTYYMRNTGVVPSLQNNGIYKAFLRRLTEYLTAIGYERISSHYQATNRRILIFKLKEGFDIAGFELTENWGPLVKLVKLLPQDRRESFYRQYGKLDHM